ncbi:MAG: helix-turn-helix transcriptional regulator [Chloroflexi bacterium]|nr:helix-turn-helix transcriptional regulator [Chloroflexota bacterium]
MSIEHAILGLLSLSPLSGYDIKKMFEGSAALYWSGNNNQIYKTLVKLHEQDLVTRETQIQDSSPAKKVYSISEKGLEELRRWVSSAPEVPQVRNSFLIQLAWADSLSADELDNLLERYENELRMQLSMLDFQRQQRNISPSGTARDAYINVQAARTPRETFLWNMILENWSSYYQAELDWVCKLRAEARQF